MVEGLPGNWLFIFIDGIRPRLSFTGGDLVPGDNLRDGPYQCLNEIMHPADDAAHQVGITAAGFMFRAINRQRGWLQTAE